jgi:hypothetical protein
MSALNERGKEGGFMSRVLSYNQSKVWEFYRIRTEKLMVVLSCIDNIPKDVKVLCIGPRNEAEILLLSLYGFRLSNIKGIDLFSYSPLIKCEDMHCTSFEDNSFDLIYSAWTLKYAYDLKKACAEIVRVAKPGALVATGFTHTATITEVVGAPITGGWDELLGIFSPNIEFIHFQEVAPVPNDPQSFEVTAVFRIRKD